MCDTNIVAYLSLGDFAHDVIAVDNLVRVEAINRVLDSNMPGGLIQWLVIVTAQISNGIAMAIILTGEMWKVAPREEPRHNDNLDEAVWLVRKYLSDAGFCTAPGVLNPKAVMDNIIHATADLWHFEDKRLVPNDLATGTALAGDDQPPGGQPGDIKSLHQEQDNAHE